MESRLTTFPLNQHDLKASLDALFKAELLGGISRPLGNTISHLVALKVRFAIIQREVNDPDFEAEHDSYYSKWTSFVPRRCKRIHFFSADVEDGPVLKVIDALHEKSTDAPIYCGFVTLRPLQNTPQAATILSPILYPNGHSFIVARDTFDVNLAGRKFYVTGTPFFQQDNAVGACAQASIWMALRTLRRKSGQNAHSPAEITEAATRFLVRGRTLPNRTGLSIEQIVEAIRQSGYAPHFLSLKHSPHEPASSEEIMSIRRKVYPYVESGIPVLLGVMPKNQEGHAILVIGHDWEKHPHELLQLDHKENGNIWRIPTATGKGIVDLVDASSWINHFYVHNDNTGPYIPLLNTEPSLHGYKLDDAFFAVPFLHKDVLMDAEEAQLACYKIFVMCLGNAVDKLPRLVFRVYMQSRADFRESVMASCLDEPAKEYYRMKWLPKRVWVAEVNIFQDYELAPEGKNLRVAEILLDPSSDPQNANFLSVRISRVINDFITKGAQGLIVDRDPFSEKISGFQIDSGACAPISQGA